MRWACTSQAGLTRGGRQISARDAGAGADAGSGEKSPCPPVPRPRGDGETLVRLPPAGRVVGWTHGRPVTQHLAMVACVSWAEPLFSLRWVRGKRVEFRV